MIDLSDYRGKIRLFALDLDGTLLRTDKSLSARNIAALTRAAESGIEIVPTTGRFYTGIPDAVRALPFIHYAITINGAQVIDLCKDNILYRAEIPHALAADVLSALDRYPVYYDCYLGNWGWCSASMRDQVTDYVSDPAFLHMIRHFRTEVPELKRFILDRQDGVQKLLVFAKDPSVLKSVRAMLNEKYPELSVTSSIPANLEVNIDRANKGDALRHLAEHLALKITETASFGDGLNDLSMISAAGLGVAMANSRDDVRAAADYVTLSCDDDGVADVIEQLL